MLSTLRMRLLVIKSRIKNAAKNAQTKFYVETCQKILALNTNRP